MMVSLLMHICVTWPQLVNTLMPEPMGQHIADDIFKWIFVYKKWFWLGWHLSAILSFMARAIQCLLWVQFSAMISPSYDDITYITVRKMLDCNSEFRLGKYTQCQALMDDQWDVYCKDLGKSGLHYDGIRLCFEENWPCLAGPQWYFARGCHGERCHKPICQHISFDSSGSWNGGPIHRWLDVTKFGITIIMMEYFSERTCQIEMQSHYNTANMVTIDNP